jgi:haloacetate dehalogenase
MIWQEWSDDVHGQGIDSGHRMAEEAPHTVASSLGDFFSLS